MTYNYSYVEVNSIQEFYQKLTEGYEYQNIYLKNFNSKELFEFILIPKNIV